MQIYMDEHFVVAVAGHAVGASAFNGTYKRQGAKGWTATALQQREKSNDISSTLLAGYVSKCPEIRRCNNVKRN